MMVAVATVIFGIMLSQGTAEAGATSAPVLSGSVANATSLSGAGYVAVSGNYAYTLAYFSGTLTVVDISNPSAPVVVGQSLYSDSLLNASHIAISGNYAYVVSQNRNGANGSGSNDDGTGNALTILDITNPFAPMIVGTVHDSNLLFGAHGVAVSGGYAYVAAQGCLSGQPCPDSTVGNALVVIDVSDPANPHIITSISNNALPSPWSGSGALQHACGIAVSGHYAYVTASYAGRLTVIDIANPLQPTIVASIQNGSTLPLPVDVAVANGHAYVANENGSGPFTVVDVQNPTSPRVTGSVSSSSDLYGAYRVVVRGNFAYVASTYANTMAVLDVSDPTNPRIAGAFTSSTSLHRTVGVDVDPTRQYAIAQSPWLSTETRNLYPPFPFQPGGPTDTGTVNVIQLDPEPIDVAISSTPPSTTSASTASFSFQPNDDVSTVRCQLDGGAFGLCATPTTQSYIGLAPGSHTFSVEAIDAADRTSTASYTWTILAQAPANTQAPQISGTATVGQQLQANPGTWTGSPAPTFTYQWERCDSTGSNCNPIQGATSASYLVASADVGSTLVAAVTGTNSGGNAQATSTATGVVPPPSSGFPPTPPPTTPVLDTFNRANGSVGSNWTVMHAGSFSTMNIANNVAVNPGSASQYAWNYWNPATFGPDVEAYATVATYSGNDTLRIGARVSVNSSTYNGYFVSIAANGLWSILRITAGLPTTLASGVTDPISSGDQIGIRIVGSVITALHKTTAKGWVALLSYDTMNDATRYTTAGSLSFEFRTSTIDNFGGGLVAQGPVSVTAPQISGTVAVGQQLQANPGTWTGNPAPTFTYQWQRCDSSGNNCNPIQGATNATYTIVNADAGSTLEVTVTASNSAGTNQATSAATAVVAQVPANTQLPQISGTVAVGQQLQADPGTWTGSPAPIFTYQWQRCDSSGDNCNPIQGATNATYTISDTDAGSTLNVAVTATNSAGNNQANSAATAVVPQAPANTQLPQISGTVAVGQQLQANPGTWTGNPAPTFTYQWQRCDSSGDNCNPIQGATNATYTINTADAGSTLNVTVTASNSAGTNQANSAATAVVPQQQPPANTQLPQISGTVAVGQQLQADPGTWTGSPAPLFTYQWQRCDSSGNNCNPIQGATNATYTINNADAGSTLAVVVTGTNSSGSAQAASGASSQVAQAPANTQAPQISGTVAVGQQLQANAGTWTGSPAPTFTYQWQRCDSSGNNCNPIQSATNATYTINNTDAGQPWRSL